MRIPECLESLLHHGVVDDVIRPLMSGKEAQVYLVVSDGEERVAKVYKEAQNRSFKNRAEYTEGRKVRNSRDQRAMEKRSHYGRAQDEAAWRSTEVDMIYRLRDVGVRVPTPYYFVDGVLIMELVRGPNDQPAPRLGEVAFSRQEATYIFERLLAEVVRMLCAGVVHGDLSDFNVLMGADGPVIIDFPQAVTAAGNQNARKLLLRDVENLQRFLQRFSPGARALPYAQEMWHLYEGGELKPNTTLTGHYLAPATLTRTDGVLDVIADARHDERRRREARGLSMRGLQDGGRTRRDNGDGRGHGQSHGSHGQGHGNRPTHASGHARGRGQPPTAQIQSPRDPRDPSRSHHDAGGRPAGAPSDRAPRDGRRRRRKRGVRGRGHPQ